MKIVAAGRLTVMTILNEAKAALAGVSGAIAAKFLYEVSLHVLPAVSKPNSPRAGGRPRTVSSGESILKAGGNNLAAVGELVADGIYFGLVGAFGRKHALGAGAFLGFMAGIGSVLIPSGLGLDSLAAEPHSFSPHRSIATYTAGGLVAGAVYRVLR